VARAQRNGKSESRRPHWLWLALIARVVLGCANPAGAQAQATPARAVPAAPPIAMPATAPAAAPAAADADPDAAAGPEGEPVASGEPAAPRVDAGLAQLQLKLQDVNDERAHTTRLLPWLSVGLGAGAVLVGASAGAVHVLSCDDSCRSPNWITIAVVVGATVATLGAIWVLHRDANLRELDSQRYQLEQELLRVRLSRPSHDAASAGARSMFSLSFRL
jgi:hypothetical protein